MRPTWNNYFMTLAESVSERSDDPTKVGAVIVNKDNHIQGTGYNGPPAGMPHAPVYATRETKYAMTIHAEMNAILHAYGPVRGCTIYTTLEPCGDCMKMLAAAGIAKVFYRNIRKDEVSDMIAQLMQIEKERI